LQTDGVSVSAATVLCLDDRVEVRTKARTGLWALNRAFSMAVWSIVFAANVSARMGLTLDFASSEKPARL
jgi:hypothetical protein